MSQENVDVVRRAYETFDADLDGLLRLLDPAIEWVSPSDAIEPGPRHGHGGVRAAFAATASAWERPMHIAEDFVDTGNRVLVMVTFRGHGRGSGMEAELPEFHIWTVRGGAIVRFQWFYRRDDALAAACADG
jgi:uncharacterized protein